MGKHKRAMRAICAMRAMCVVGADLCVCPSMCLANDDNLII